MKKTIYYLKAVTNFKSGYYFLILLIPLFIQSCNELKEVEGSGDLTKQSYSGPSYSSSSPDNSKVGENFGILFDLSFFSGLGKHHDRESGSINNNTTDFGTISNQYASNVHGPSAFYNTGETETEESFNTNLPSNKATSEAISAKGGIEFVQKKSKDGNTKITLNYLEVPLYALYNYKLSSGGNIFGGLGPYFAYGIGGKMKSDYNGQTSEIKSFDKTNGFKPFDAGLGITAGYKTSSSLYFRIAYEIGLVNIQRNSFGDKAKNRSISISVGYSLDKLFKK